MKFSHKNIHNRSNDVKILNQTLRFTT